MSQLCGSGLTRRSYVASAAWVEVATASAMQAMMVVESVVRMLALPCPGGILVEQPCRSQSDRRAAMIARGEADAKPRRVGKGGTRTVPKPRRPGRLCPPYAPYPTR